jgi:gamma-tubulin complex component 5
MKALPGSPQLHASQLTWKCTETHQEDPKRFTAYRENAIRTLRYHNYARTNQFDVGSRLEGLEEKFGVYCEDELAEVLRKRLDELAPVSNKWTPDILHLLLELSDKPVEKSTVRSLELLSPPEPPSPPPLKWKDLVAEDPLLRDRQVWRNVDYAADSSEDETEFPDSEFDEAESTDLSSLGDQDYLRPEALRRPVALDSLDTLKKACFWGLKQDSSGSTGTESLKAQPLTELQMIREYLLMLRGLPTSLFVKEENGKIRPIQSYRLKHASRAILAMHLEAFSLEGSKILHLRSFVCLKFDVPLMQSFQSAISKRLDHLDTLISSLEQHHLAPEEDQVVSLLAVHQKLLEPIQLLAKISDIIREFMAEPDAHPIRYLELLFNSTSIAQMAGEDKIYQFLAVLFFDCFMVYLRPIRLWMEEGQLQKQDKVFFVTEADEDVEPALIWENRYVFRNKSDGSLQAPSFLRPAANRIFNTGKSVVILKRLNRFEAAKRKWTTKEPLLDYNTVCGDAGLNLAPFSELFDVAFDNWIRSKHHATSETLRSYLFNDCGLWKSLEAMETIFFMKDGATSNIITSSIFEKLDRHKESWNDSFTLSELAQSTFASTPSIDPYLVRASALRDKIESTARSRKHLKYLGAIKLHYRLPWPVQIIITKNTAPAYHRIFTFLLQIRRSSTILLSSRHLKDGANHDSSADERALYYGIRSCLLWFCNILYNYLTEIVLGIRTTAMRKALAGAEDVDAMIHVHRSAMKQIEDQALLGTRLEPIHKSIISLLDLSIRLADARSAHISAQTQDGQLVTDMDRNNGLESSDEEGSDGEKEDSFVEKEKVEIPYITQLRTIKGQYDHTVRFIASGLRGVSRAGGEATWDVLAEKLEVGIGGDL